MCLGIPVEIKEITDNKAIVSAGGAEYEADLSLIEDAQVGDYVLMHAGYALQKLDKEEADETIKMINECIDE